MAGDTDGRQPGVFLPLVSNTHQATDLDTVKAATTDITEARLLTGIDTDKDGVSDATEALLESNINDKDTDKDGLSDYQELYLDTELLNNDTDGDQLTDFEELKGYLDGAGQRWFSDPTKADSNRDGLSDQVEMGNVNGDTIPDLVDTDSDKNPDLYDSDNDNDGVLDRLDLSPFTRMGTTAAPFNAANPFRLTLNDLQPNVPTFVDIQLRPTASDHLWYAFNVLDWPSDRDGNVQDWDNATFATAAKANSPAGQLASTPASENYGDMRLLPMLEISIPGSTPNLPSMSDLLAYNVIVRDLTSDGTATGAIIGKMLYVPLALETNEQTGEQVAFRARIPYLPGAAWGNAHEMRVVWSVQVLMDFPCDPTDDAAAKQGCIPNSGKSALLFGLPPSLETDLAKETVSGALIQAFIDNRIALQAPAKVSVVKAGQRWEVTAGLTLLGGQPNPSPTVYVIKKENGALNLYLVSPSLIRNSPQVVQTYPEDWVLTGLNVREDQGVKMAVIYEDPAVDSELQDNTALWPLAQGMDETFLTGADRDQNGQTDITVNEIARRFDRLGNGAVSEDERWGIDNILRVERAGLDFPHMDRAVATIAMTTTKAILNSVFSPRWSPSVPLTPTLMFANEATYRGVGLDGLRNSSPYLALAGSALTVDLTPNGGTPLAPETVHSLKWSLYCATGPSGVQSAPTWRECAGQQVWEEMAARFAGVAAEPGDSDEIGRGRLGFIQLAAMTLANGVSSVVKSNGVLISNPDALSDSLLRQQWTQAKAGRTAGKGIVKLLSYKFDSFKLTTEGKAAVLRKIGIRLVPGSGRLTATWDKYGKGILGKIESKLGSTKGWVNKGALGFAVLLVAASIAFGIAAPFFFGKGGTASIVSAAVSLAVTVALNVLQPLVMTWRWATQLVSVTVSRLSALGTVLKGSAALVGTARSAAAAGAVIGVLAVWGFFIYSVAKGDVPSGGPEFGAALAGAIATTIFLVALALLSLLPGGVILAGILAMIDGILALVCAIQGTEQKDCFSISGKVIAFIADLFYGFELMINVDDPNLVKRGDPKITLRNPTLGYVAANTFNLSLPVTTTITHVDPDSIAMESYTELFTMNNLRSTTFSYSLTTAKWQLTVPQGIEGFYQTDLRVVDGLGVDSLGNPDARRANHQRLDTVWRGVVDTLAPRLTIDAVPSGITQPTTDPLRYELIYTIAADDLHLDQASFKSSCDADAQAVRGYLTTPWQAQLFPDLTIRNHVHLTCRAWGVGVNATQAAACDIYGNCSTVNNSVPPGSIPAQQNAPVIIWPLAGAVVPAVIAAEVQGAAANALQVNVQVAAVAAAGLKQIVILANGQIVKSLTYAQADQMTQKVETVTVNLPSEGQYQLVVQSTDWNGAVQTNTAPPTFSFDTQAPTVALLTDVLTAADTFGVGSGIMRFHGIAGDSVGLAAVQIQVDGGLFQDVTLRADGTWSTALYLGPDAYGKTYQITVQAIDQAGRRTTATKAVLVNIAAPVETDPLPTPQPGETPIATPIPTATPVATATPAPPVSGTQNLYLPIIRR